MEIIGTSFLAAMLTLIAAVFVLVVDLTLLGYAVNFIHRLATGGNSGIFPPPDYQPWQEQAQPVVYMSQPQRAALPAASFANEPRLIGRQSINQ